MTRQVITDEDGTVIDEYDDEQSRDEAPSTEESDSQEAGTPVPAPERNALRAQAFQVPECLAAGDLYIGAIVQQDDGHEDGPLVAVCVHMYDGRPETKAYRAAELSSMSFLDTLQKGLAATMQAYLLADAERRSKKLAEEARRAKPRVVPPPAKALEGVPSAPSTSPAAPAHTSSAARPTTAADAQPAAPKTAKPTAATLKKYQQVSMF